MSDSRKFPALSYRMSKFEGGGRPRFLGLSQVSPFAFNYSQTHDLDLAVEIRSVVKASTITQQDFASDTLVYTVIPIRLVAPCMTKSQLKQAAKLHGVKVKARANNDAIAQSLVDHSLLTNTSADPKRRNAIQTAAANLRQRNGKASPSAALKRQRKQKRDVKVKVVEVEEKEEAIFPPAPASHKLRHSSWTLILSRKQVVQFADYWSRSLG
ncbi:hypothetical protein R3P38DRAFT_2777059 [Favolaschia claudopus]|uniref:Uncharacterized protein n=1 Tax=Favolaschia claudopus TaxID=2862362 RepID=A0AAW0BJX9_9AGAR